MRRWLSNVLSRRPNAVAQPAAPPTAGPNARVWQAVEAFLSTPKSPRHALLIDGPWGVGKTHFQIALRSSYGEGRRWVYASLYGVSSKADIDDAVFAALYPLLSGRGAAVLGALGTAVLRHLKFDLKIDPRMLLNRKSVDVIVFDDLERSRLPAGELLGYINGYVEHEHDALKVVLLANVDELARDAEFGRTREKVIGRTLKLAPDFDAAFGRFAMDLSDAQTRDQLRAAEDRIRALFQQSGTGNLRILHQTIWDFARLVAAMAPHHRLNSEAMASVLDVVFILSFELRSSGIDVGDLNDRRTQWIRGAVGNGELTAIRRLSEKYPDAVLVETPISDNVLRGLLVDGVVDAARVQADLEQSRWFLATEEPAWRIAWRSHELPDELVEPAVDEMNRIYAARGYTLAGEILHVLGIRLWLADIGRIPLDRAAVEADGRAYIDEVRDMGTLEPRDNDVFYRVTGHGGLGYTESRSEEFGRLSAYLDEQRVEADLRRLPEHAATLFEELKADPDLFARRILPTGGADSRWSQDALLHHIDPEVFAEWVAARSPASQRNVLISLSVRYDHAALERHLAPERDWLDQLRASLLRRAADRPPIARDRLSKNVEWFLKPVIEGREAVE